MNMSVEQFRTVLRDAAEELTETDVPALSLQPAGRHGTSAASRGRRRHRGSAGPRPVRPPWIAPLTAAAAILLVVALSVVIAAGHGHKAATLPAASQAIPVPVAPPAPGLSLHSVPRYYTALVPDTHNTNYQAAAIRDTITGKTIATIDPPSPYTSFSEITGAADDRTFVVTAQSHGGFVGPADPPIGFFLIRFSPARGAVMTPLAIPRITGNAEETGLALSPDGSKLAVAVQPDANPAVQPDANQEVTQIRIYSLATGAVRTWQQSGGVTSQNQENQSALSWAPGGRLAFNWYPLGYSSHKTTCYSTVGAGGLYLLNTGSAGGSLLASSRLSVEQWQPGGLYFSTPAIVTPDGSKVVAPLIQEPFVLDGTCLRIQALPTPNPANNIPVVTLEFEEFAAATGRPLNVIYPEREPFINSFVAVVWSNSSGSVLVVQARARHGKNFELGVVSGRQFILIPGETALLEGDPKNSFAF